MTLGKINHCIQPLHAAMAPPEARLKKPAPSSSSRDSFAPQSVPAQPGHERPRPRRATSAQERPRVSTAVLPQATVPRSASAGWVDMSAPIEQAAPLHKPTPPTRRESLLIDHLAAKQRPLDRQQALAAVKLRCAAEVYCDKNEWTRLAPHLPQPAAKQARFEALAAMDVDALIDEVQAHPQRYSRTLLTDLAQHHLVGALNIDLDQFKQGLHRAGLYEGLHSVAGRVASTTAAAASAGVSHIPNVSHALESSAKVLAHQLPPNVINPLLTGTLRSVTDVKQTFKRVGGQPVVAPNIEKSPDMRAIVSAIKVKREQLRVAVERLQQAGAQASSDPQALGLMVDAFLSLHDVANGQYRRRIGLNRTQTYSKGWGMAVNAVAAVGTVVTAAVPGVGQIAGPTILATCIPLQWGAGYLDERRVKHWYNLRANTKWANFLTEEAANVHFKDLLPEHVCEAALRNAFVLQPNLQVAAIREVYVDDLGERVLEHLKLQHQVATMSYECASDSVLAPHCERLQALAQQMECDKQAVADFESFDAARWRSIPADSLMGQCLDDLKALERANRSARRRKPGEGAQILQRYAQAFHGGLSTGTMLPIMDGLVLTDHFYAHDAAGLPTQMESAPQAGALTAGVVGGVVFTATTGEVRVRKADNKKLLATQKASAEQLASDAALWVFQANDQPIDLRASGAYHRHTHSTWSQLKLVGRALPGSLFGGPAGLVHLTRAKAWSRGEVGLAEAQMRQALNTLAATGLATFDSTEPPRRANNLSALKDQLYDYPAVRTYLERQ
jgi:hypothetical protein